MVFEIVSLLRGSFKFFFILSAMDKLGRSRPSQEGSTKNGTIGVARILCGVHFFPKKVDDLFLVVALSKLSKTV